MRRVRRCSRVGKLLFVCFVQLGFLIPSRHTKAPQGSSTKQAYQWRVPTSPAREEGPRLSASRACRIPRVCFAAVPHEGYGRARVPAEPCWTARRSPPQNKRPCCSAAVCQQHRIPRLGLSHSHRWLFAGVCCKRYTPQPPLMGPPRSDHRTTLPLRSGGHCRSVSLQGGHQKNLRGELQGQISNNKGPDEPIPISPSLF